MLRKVQDEMTERWALRLREDDEASKGRRSPEKGVASVGGGEGWDALMA